MDYQQCGTCGKVEEASGQCSGCREVTDLHFFEAISIETHEDVAEIPSDMLELASLLR